MAKMYARGRHLHDYTICPYCGQKGDDSCTHYYGSFMVTEGAVARDCECMRCHEGWRDSYTTHDVLPFEQGHINAKPVLGRYDARDIPTLIKALRRHLPTLTGDGDNLRIITFYERHIRYLLTDLEHAMVQRKTKG